MDLHPTKQANLDLAATIAEERGEAAMRLWDIEDALGVAPPSIYNFFGSREGPNEAVYEERFSPSLLEFQEPVDRLVWASNSQEESRDAFRVTLKGLLDSSGATPRVDRISALAAGFILFGST